VFCFVVSRLLLASYKPTVFFWFVLFFFWRSSADLFLSLVNRLYSLCIEVVAEEDRVVAVEDVAEDVVEDAADRAA
jgi:hypothetical protein